MSQARDDSTYRVSKVGGVGSTSRREWGNRRTPLRFAKPCPDLPASRHVLPPFSPLASAPRHHRHGVLLVADAQNACVQVVR